MSDKWVNPVPGSFVGVAKHQMRVHQTCQDAPVGFLVQLDVLGFCNMAKQPPFLAGKERKLFLYLNDRLVDVRIAERKRLGAQGCDPEYAEQVADVPTALDDHPVELVLADDRCRLEWCGYPHVDKAAEQASRPCGTTWPPRSSTLML